MSTFPISARTIAAGITIVGPVNVAAGLSSMSMILDIGNLVDPCDFLLEIAFNGVDFLGIAGQRVTGPPRNRDGTPAVPADMHWQVNFGNDASGPVLTNSSSKARLTLDNATAFATAGGSLTVS